MLFVGADHGGFRLKQALCSCLRQHLIDFEDVGTDTDLSCDYPIYARKVAVRVQQNTSNRGVLICTSGVGMSIAANKFKGIYAARLTELSEVQQSIRHNGINVLCLPGNLPIDKAYDLVRTLLDTTMDEAERHVRRRQQVKSFEK